MATEDMSKDPLSGVYYKSVSIAEKLMDFAFYIAGILSFVVLALSRDDYPMAYDFSQSMFIAMVLISFFGGIAIRLYWSSRAHEQRVADFFSNAFSVRLSDEVSVGYYNSDRKEPFPRIASAVLENTLFSKEICRRMCRSARIFIFVYVVMWGFVALNRSTDLAIIATAAQALFSEQLVSRWIRLEWLRHQCEQIYRKLYSNIQMSGDFSSSVLKARILEQNVIYECAKAQAGISLSSRVFKRLNPSLSQKWIATSRHLGV